jgi:hypothetical protein
MNAGRANAGRSGGVTVRTTGPRRANGATELDRAPVGSERRRERGSASGPAGGHPAGNDERRDDRPEPDARSRPVAGTGSRDDVDQVVVDHDRQRRRFERRVKREQPLIDNDIADGRSNTRGAHLTGEPVQTGEGILRSELRTWHEVGVGVIDIAKIDRPIRLGTPVERQVPSADERKIAGERAAGASPDGVDRRRDPRIRSEDIPRGRDRPQLRARAGHEQPPVGSELRQRPPGARVDDQIAPRRADVSGLSDDPAIARPADRDCAAPDAADATANPAPHDATNTTAITDTRS